MNRKAVLITCVLLSLPYILLLSFFRNVDNHTYANTVEFSATVTDAQIVKTNKKSHIKIFINEYCDYILISSNIADRINAEKIEDIQINSIAKFRIERKKIMHINNSDFVDVVSLSIDDDVIFSMDDYNKYMKESAITTRIVTVALYIVQNIVILCVFVHQKRKQ